MFLHLISERDRLVFLQIAKLFCLSDNSILWDGKSKDEINSDTEMGRISFEIVESEKIIIDSFERECQKVSLGDIFGVGFLFGKDAKKIDADKIDAEKLLLEKIRKLPFSRQSEPIERLSTAVAVLKELVMPDVESLPSTPKVMLYELMQLCLADGVISSIEWALLKEFSVLRDIDSYIFDDILECAEINNKAAIKAASIIFE